MTGCTNYRPDHNGECLNCDEPADEHLDFLRGEVERLRALDDTNLVALHDAMVRDTEKRCDFPEHLELMVDLANMLATLAELRAERSADFKLLASAMRKVLPPKLLAEVIAHLDPLTPFVAFLQAHDDSK